ncbi:MAG: glycosyltransferase family 4 protein [Candidatus Omnitrophica bacterium]|nr:glycosyltransferase family 4 protein [Candidatus Omnitrophota bacterium]MBU4478282.1 glycosyltransferase family 4 protein [Candidatus Omnitrophota bacterium]MCG2703350.1 glycosyltransferase family 4 protein [Candidatus Omnitrophota bacterium]
MKILMVTFSFYPDGIGGMHSYVYNLGKELIKKGHDVYVITVKMKKDAPDEEVIEGMKVYRYDEGISGNLVYIRRFILSIINGRRLFSKLVKKIEFDVINFHSIFPAYGINLLFKIKNIPRIYTFHSSAYKDILIQSKKKRYAFPLLNELIFLLVKHVECMSLKAADRIIVLSNFSKRYIVDTYLHSSEKIILIPGGVDSSNFSPLLDKTILRNKLNLPDNKLILLTARRLVARMGLENLILAMPIISEEIPRIFLLILGDGFLKKELKRLISKEGLEEKVELLGFVDFKMISDYYQAADIFILPSEQDEWFGLVALEGLSSGLPVLSTPTGGSLEILSRFDESLIFAGTSPRDIAQGIISFVKRTNDLAEFGKKCRQFILENYSWERVAGEIELLYNKEIKKITDRRLYA